MIDTRFPASLHIMTLLAFKSDMLLSSADIARSLKTNPAFVRKLVGSLVDAHLILSVRGKSGGLKLGRPATTISLKDIYLASTGEKNLICVPSKSPTSSCKVSCSMDQILKSIADGVEHSALSFLSNLRLDQVVEAAKDSRGL